MRTVLERRVGCYKITFFTIDGERCGFKVKRFNTRKKTWTTVCVVTPENKSVIAICLPKYVEKAINDIARVIEAYYGLKVTLV